VDAERPDVGMVEKLRGAEKEWEELIIVETPYTVRPGGFEVVGCLDETHEMEVTGEG